MGISLWKLAFLVVLVELQSSRTLTQSYNEDNDVLQVPSVKHLLYGLNFNNIKNTIKENDQEIHSEARQHDVGDGVLPATKDEKKGEFEFESEDKASRGKGTYTMSDKDVSLRIKMTLKQGDCKPDGETQQETTKTPPPTKATSTTESKPTAPSTKTTPTTESKPTAAPPTKATPSADKTTDKVAPTKQTTPATSATTKPQNSSTKGCEDSPFIKEGLATHNKYRSIHGAPGLKIDCTLSKHAADYAQKLADLGSLVHSGYSERPGDGENLGMECTSSDAGQSATLAVKNWYDEVCKYKFGEDGPQKSTDHFTQVVWKASQDLGMGMAQKEEDGVKCSYVVARYKPLGNFNDGSIGYKDNVLKGSFAESYCNTLKDGTGVDGGYGLKRGQTKRYQ